MVSGYAMKRLSSCGFPVSREELSSPACGELCLPTEELILSGTS